MRISADPKSPHYSSRSLRAAVFLDGAQLRHCVTADDVEGMVEIYSTDEQGNILHDGECATMEVRTGRVSITFEGMNFDAWMRARTDAAHAAYMARHAAGGIAHH